MASAQSTGIRKLKPAGLARELGVTRQAIHELVKRSILSVDADGLIDVELAKVALANRVRPSGKTAAALASPPAPMAQQPATPATDPNATSYHVAKTLREVTEAKIAQVKLAEMEKRLIAKEPAVTAAYTAFRSLRDAGMTLGRKLASKLAPMTDQREIQLAIDAAVREVFDTFANRTLVSLVENLGDGAMPEDATA